MPAPWKGSAADLQSRRAVISQDLGQWDTPLPSLVGKDQFYDGAGKAPDFDWPNPSFVVQTRAANQAARLAQDSSQVHQFLHELDGKDLFRGGFGKAPNWDWPNPSFVVQIRAAYRAAQLAQDTNQVHQFFHGLDGKDALPTGQSTIDTRLPPAGRQVRTWKAQDSVDSGLALTADVGLPPGDVICAAHALTPQRAPARDYSIAASFPLSLLGQDAVNVGEQSVDLPPRAAARARDYSVTGSYTLSLIGQDQLPTGEQSVDLPVPAAPRRRPALEPGVTALALTAPPVGVQAVDLPPRAASRAVDYTWLQQFALDVYGNVPIGQNTALTALPPRGPSRARDYTFVASFLLELIGQDAFNAGAQSVELPPRAPARAVDYTWTQTFALDVYEQLPVGASLTDLPFPPAPRRARDYTFVQSFPLELIGKDQRNPGQSTEATALPPRGPSRARDYTFIGRYTLELIGKDAFPAGEQVFDLPTPARPRHQSPLEPGTDALALTVAPEPLPNGQQTFDLPAVTAPRRQSALEVGAQALALGVTVAPTPTPPAPDFVQPGGKGSRSRPLLTRYKPEQAPRYVSGYPQPPQPTLRAHLTVAPAPRLVTARLSAVRPALDAQVHVFNPCHVSARLSGLPPTLRSCRQLSAPGCTTLAVRVTRPSLRAQATHTPDETWLLAFMLAESHKALQIEATKRLSNRQRALNAQVARTDQQQSRLVSAAQPHIRHALNVQRDAILVALPHAVKTLIDTTALLDDPGYKDALVLLINAIEDLQQAGVTLGYTDATPNDVFDMQNPYVIAATALLAQRIVGINETTADAIRAAIADGLEQGLSVADMGSVIRDLGAFSDSRALTLAATESRTALNLGNAASFQEMGATEVLVADGDYDDVCAELDGSTQSLDWYQANPIGHPNCRRTATALPALIPA